MIIGNKKEIQRYLDSLEDDDTEYELKKHKKVRNKDQNAKYWKLLYQLSLKLKIGIEELHKQMLKNYSVRYEVLIPDDVQLRGVEYYDRKSALIKNGKRFITYHIYTPSHELKTDEFALLLEGLVEECKIQGIDTRSPVERIEEYNENNF